MKIASLIAWIVTAALGSSLVLIWLARGGHRRPQDSAEQNARRPGQVGRVPLGLTVHLLIPHAVLALVGLILWAAFVADSDDYEPARVVAPLILAAVGALGVWMFRRWARASRAVAADTRPERAVPATLVTIHGLAALVAAVLVVLVVVLD